jgi:hypothetical protein
MARNRKYQSAAIRFGPTLKALLFCLLIGGSGVGYVWQKDQIYRLGKQITAREIRLQLLATQNEKLGRELAARRSPQFLQTKIQQMNLGLLQPEPNQVWQLPEPSRERPAQRLDQQFAAHTSRSPAIP